MTTPIDPWQPKREAWLVKHKLGTCALKFQRRTSPPPAGTLNVPTLCGEFIVLPFGYERGWPSCAECSRLLALTVAQ